MDNLSFLLFFIYAMIILILLIYISPVISAIVMIIIPVAIVFIYPEPAAQLLSIEQFSYLGVSINNIHIMLMLWSALLGIIIYSELLSWYLLMDESRSEERKEISAADMAEPEEPPRSIKQKIEDFLLSLGKIMSGGK
ncbi:MAG: hypothetical protein Q8M95_12995 [Candidatus Methanoperedens sp.]|nr:hypothetical protein [Candidatus Methanoperedens sp.]